MYVKFEFGVVFNKNVCIFSTSWESIAVTPWSWFISIPLSRWMGIWPSVTVEEAPWDTHWNIFLSNAPKRLNIANTVRCDLRRKPNRRKGCKVNEDTIHDINSIVEWRCCSQVIQRGCIQKTKFPSWLVSVLSILGILPNPINFRLTDSTKS